MLYPKVSLHVAICSEPPDVVVETLEALSRLDYPNFEVLVIDSVSQPPVEAPRPVEKMTKLRLVGDPAKEIP